MTLITADTGYELIKAPHTGLYYNAGTDHQAWYPQGALMPPEYLPVENDGTGAEEIDDKQLSAAVAAETVQLTEARIKAEDQAEADALARQKAEATLAEVEEAQASALQTAQDRIAELENQLAQHDGTEAEETPTGSNTPRARRKATDN